MTNKRAKLDTNDSVDVGLNPSYTTDIVLDTLGTAFRNHLPAHIAITPRQQETHSDNLIASTDPLPFRSVVLPSIFNPSFISLVKQSIQTLPFQLKSNDLYTYHQSTDLRTTTHPILSTLRTTIYSPTFIRIIERITGFTLLHTMVDVSVHKYPQNGYLLCHDDAVGTGNTGRRIAFLVYLVDKDWSTSDGGLLHLYDSDNNGHPNNIIRSITPRLNTMAFFEVTSTSHHEVQQVFGSRDRLSISGWFHGPLNETTSSIPPSMVDETGDIELDRVLSYPLIRKWINPAYLTPQSIASINTRFTTDSCIDLRDFVNTSMYTRLCDAFNCVNFDKVVGPPNMCRYHTISHSIPPDCPTHTPMQQHHILIHEYKSLVSSPIASILFSKMTGLDLNTKAWCSNVRVFGRGSYTLVHDGNVEPVGLDVVFDVPGMIQSSTTSTSPSSISSSMDLTKPYTEPTETQIDINATDLPEWNDKWGGAIHYIHDTDTLASMYPSPNTLHLVYRDTDTLRFVKLINQSSEMIRRDISVVFTE